MEGGISLQQSSGGVEGGTLAMWDGIPIVSLTPSVLLGIAVLMLFLGKLWTNKAYQEKCQEAERWRKAYEASEEARAISSSQTTELLELAKTTYSIIDATFSTPGRHRPPGGPYVVPVAK